jgi:hypothetical protein
MGLGKILGEGVRKGSLGKCIVLRDITSMRLITLRINMLIRVEHWTLGIIRINKDMYLLLFYTYYYLGNIKKISRFYRYC